MFKLSGEVTHVKSNDRAILGHEIKGQAHWSVVVPSHFWHATQDQDGAEILM